MKSALLSSSALDSVPATNGQATTATVYIDGRALNRLLRGATASQRAIIANDLHSGRWKVVWPYTWEQSLLLTGASYGYAYTGGTLSEAERDAVMCRQLGLAAFHNTPSPFAAWMRATNEVLAELGQFESISCGDLLDRAHAKMTEAERTSLNEAFDRMPAAHTVPTIDAAATNGNGSTSLSDGAIDAFIAKAGADRVLAALDRFTAPTRANGDGQSAANGTAHANDNNTADADPRQMSFAII